MIDANRLAVVQLIVFDFDGVFTDNTVYVTQDGIESVRCWRSDGLGLTRLRSAGVKLLIVSTENNPVVTARATKLRLPCKQGIDDKAEAVLLSCREFGVTPERTMFVGNDINDIPAFAVVGLPVAVADAHPDVDLHVIWRTKRPGGFGAVREICDAVFNAGRLDNGRDNHG
ncbi:KdsC family phosphatase [Bradyrhizobium shewense]|uniref:KdsC family phosphatase n=1 Tax=Bradyrhizobium shewense TaxID=1761772 RepID=UPI000B815B4B|nr:HAD family hydrolase [Bradyrhizobium shewense]